MEKKGFFMVRKFLDGQEKVFLIRKKLFLIAFPV